MRYCHFDSGTPVSKILLHIFPHWKLQSWCPWFYSSSQSPSSRNNVSWCPGCMGQYWSQQEGTWLVEIRRSSVLIGRRRPLDTWWVGWAYCHNHCPLWRFSMEQMGRKTHLIPSSREIPTLALILSMKLSINENFFYHCKALYATDPSNPFTLIIFRFTTSKVQIVNLTFFRCNSISLQSLSEWVSDS